LEAKANSVLASVAALGGRKKNERKKAQIQIKTLNKTRGLSHHGLSIYIKKKYLQAKEELWKFKYFSMQKYIIFKKQSSKRNQNPSRYQTLELISSFSTSQNIIFQKSWYKNRPIW
jgi:tRNA U34 5-carboxymethylaminomethyl modifying enzyme MnmG/GidA